MILKRCCLGNDGGYLSPRKFVLAQKKIASDHGCVVIPHLVTDLDTCHDNRWMVSTATGDSYTCDTVVLCQGTYLGLGRSSIKLWSYI